MDARSPDLNSYTILIEVLVFYTHIRVALRDVGVESLHAAWQPGFRWRTLENLHKSLASFRESKTID
jgi:hypothetical protein